MFSYSPTVNNQSGAIMGAGLASAAATRAQAMSNLGDDIGGALETIGRAYGQYSGARRQADAFDTTMGAAKEAGLIDQNTLEMFMNTPWQQKAQAFNLFQNTIFPIQANQQKVQAQAQAWAQYRGGQGGGTGGGTTPTGRNKSGFTF